jgi:hypothetical protein
MRYAWVLLFVFACAEPAKGVEVQCRAVCCPTADEINAAQDIVAGYVDLDPDEPLKVEWHAEGEVFVVYGYPMSGYTPSTSKVVVTGWRSFGHEVHHVALWRSEDNPDAYHKDEEEWTVTDFAIKDHLSATMPAPSDCY